MYKRIRSRSIFPHRPQRSYSYPVSRVIVKCGTCDDCWITAQMTYKDETSSEEVLAAMWRAE